MTSLRVISTAALAVAAATIASRNARAICPPRTLARYVNCYLNCDLITQI